MTDSEFLNWLGDRLVHVYGESENVDFVLKVRRLAQAAAQPASAEAGKGARDPDAACAPCGLCHQLDGHALNCPNSPSESVADELGEVVRAAIWDSAEVVAPGRLSQPEPTATPAGEVVDQEPASMSHNGSCGSQVSGKPVSAEADRYKRALEAIIANPGGASAKRIVTLALGLDGTEQVSAEAKPLPVGWLPNLVDGELLVPTASAEAGKGVGREAYIADLIDTFEQLRQILGTPEQDADALIATVRRLAAFDSPQEAAEREAQLQEAREQGWRAAIDVYSRHGMAGWSSHKDAALSAPQEASKPENTRFPMNVYLRNEDELWDFMMENLQELVAKRGIQLSRGR